MAHPSSRPPSRAATADELNRETDARFWSTTHYKVGQKLNPTIPTDAAMVKVWLSIFGQVKHEDEAGTLRLTFDHPAVQAGLSDAAEAQAIAHDRADRAQVADDPAQREQLAHAAASAQAEAAEHASQVAELAQHPPAPAPAQDAASAQAAQTPPPPAAAASEHLAHEQAVHPPAPRRPAHQRPPTIFHTMPAGSETLTSSELPPPPSGRSTFTAGKAIALGIALAATAALLYAATRSNARDTLPTGDRR